MSCEPDPEAMEPCLGCAVPCAPDELHNAHCPCCAATSEGDLS